jgi:hypothetical protein
MTNWPLGHVEITQEAIKYEAKKRQIPCHTACISTTSIKRPELKPSGHVPHAGQGHHGELQAFVDPHGYHVDVVNSRVEFTRFLAHAVRQPALELRCVAQVHGVPVAAQDGQVAPGVAAPRRSVQKCVVGGLLEPFGRALFVGRLARYAGVRRRYQCCHWCHPVPEIVCGSLWLPNASRLCLVFSASK